MATGVVVVAILVVAGLIVVSLRGDVPDGGSSDLRGLGGGTVRTVVPDVRFPAAAPDALPPEPRQRPLGVRSLELGFEAPVVAEAERPSCATSDLAFERVIWFDGAASSGATDAALTAVAPGEHGIAMLLGGAQDAVSSAPLRGIGAAEVGVRIEVGRADGTVLSWRIVDVVVVRTGSVLPEAVLVPAPEQRLLVAGCGATVGGQERDVYVLALRER